MEDLYHIASSLGNLLQERKLKVCTAESCTGGGLACALTAIPGISSRFDCGWVTYSNNAKHELLGVPEALIKTHGAVSKPVVEAMATGALAQAKANVSMATTGIAGPSGGTPEKPVGTVWLAWAVQTPSGEVVVKSELLSLSGDREKVRNSSIIHALRECEHFVKSLYS